MEAGDAAAAREAAGPCADGDPRRDGGMKNSVPSEERLGALDDLIEAGALTDIEEWARAILAESPGCEDFAREVLRLAGELGLDAMRALVARARS